MIREGVFDEPSVAVLVERHIEHCNAETHPDKCHRLPLSALQTPDIRFWTYWEDGEAVGCIALRDLGEGKGEVKSMHVIAERRGSTIAHELLDHLEAEAKASGMKWLGLETGDSPNFQAALRFYEKRGYQPTTEFGNYTAENAGPLRAREI